MTFFIKSYSQTPILPLGDVRDINGAYYKDLNNQLDPFVGTWKYTNGNTSLTITLQKKLIQEFQDGGYHFFHDILAGEYKYIENNIEKINTLSEFSVQKGPFEYSITGNILFGQGKYLRTEFSQYDVNIPGMETAMFFERVDFNGVQKLKLIFKMTEGPIEVEGQSYPNPYFTLPFGEYILIKQ